MPRVNYLSKTFSLNTVGSYSPALLGNASAYSFTDYHMNDDLFISNGALSNQRSSDKIVFTELQLTLFMFSQGLPVRLLAFVTKDVSYSINLNSPIAHVLQVQDQLRAFGSQNGVATPDTALMLQSLDNAGIHPIFDKFYAPPTDNGGCMVDDISIPIRLNRDYDPSGVPFGSSIVVYVASGNGFTGTALAKASTVVIDAVLTFENR